MPYYGKRSRSRYSRYRRRGGYGRRRATRKYGKYSKRSSMGIARYSGTAHFPKPVVSRRLAQLSVELKTRQYAGVFKLNSMLGSTGSPYYGIPGGLVPITAPAVNDTLVGIPVGLTPFHREGREVACRSLHIRGQIYRPDYGDPGAIISDDTVIVALVRDKAANLASASSEQIFSSLLTGTAGPTSIMLNPSSKNRFQVLASKTIRVRQTNFWKNLAVGPYTAAPSCNIPFEFYVNLKGMKIHFENEGGSSDAILDNNINLYAWSMWNATTAVGTPPAIPDPEQEVFVQFQSELRFVG